MNKEAFEIFRVVCVSIIGSMMLATSAAFLYFGLPGLWKEFRDFVRDNKPTTK